MNCDKCEYAATIVADLKRHFQIKGERYLSHLINVSTLQLQLVVRSVILRVNMKE